MIAEAWDSLLAMTLAASALAAGLLVLRLPLRRAFGARIAYLAWLVVPFGLLAVLLPAPQAAPASMRFMQAAASTVAALPVSGEAPLDARPAGLLLWLAGTLVVLVVFVVRQVRFNRHLHRSGGTSTPAERAIRRAPAQAGGPAVVGLWRPRIVLPDDFEARWSPAERELILAHEQVHLARGDTRINALMAFVRALNWFNPLVHLAAGRMRIDQELACDAAVLAKFPQARRRYAEAMLKTQLDVAPIALATPPAACHWADGNTLKERIIMLKKPLPARSLHLAGVFLTVLLACGAACVAWASQSPRPAVGPADAATVLIDAQVSIGIGSEEKSTRLVTPAGASFRMSSDGGASTRWEAELTPRVLDDGNLEIAAVIRDDGGTIATPSMVVRPGEAATLEQSAAGRHAPLRLVASLAQVRDDGAAAVEPSDRSVGYARLSPPQRPLDAMGKPLDGSVLLKVRVGIDGRVLAVEPVTLRAAAPTSGSVEQLVGAARSAVATWTFDPAWRNSKPIESEVIVPITFGAVQGSAIADSDVGGMAVLDEIHVGDG